ncbi:hypothetical protein [Flagellimonas profundi]|uniref:Uncharacterized protein n=1 Tax=Flagellimonas profundi TaxID=2915620 RepID=A0ABS3FCR7_9FLAO|nr:hypothetical protein [Allomuricauda profundi]MBO0340941.1 hypothetical protein [Allomuricauda profundi]
MNDILRQYDILDRRLSIPQWVKDEIHTEVACIMNENLVEGIINEMLKDERAIKQVGLQRAWLIDTSIETNSDEYKALYKKAKGEYTQTKRVDQLKAVLTNWDIKKQGMPTNKNLAEYVGIKESTITRSYSTLIKEEKRLAKEGKNRGSRSDIGKKISLYYDDKGIGYDHGYLMRTNEKLYFPLNGKYTVNNFGEICKKNQKGQYKVMSVDKDGFCQLTIEGKRCKVNPTKTMVEVLFKEMTEPNREELGESFNLFSMNKEQLQENIKEHSNPTTLTIRQNLCH